MNDMTEPTYAEADLLDQLNTCRDAAERVAAFTLTAASTAPAGPLGDGVRSLVEMILDTLPGLPASELTPEQAISLAQATRDGLITMTDPGEDGPTGSVSL